MFNTRAWMLAIPIPVLAFAFAPLAALPAELIPPIERRLPPPGNSLNRDVRTRLEQRVDELQQRLAPHNDHPQAADVEIFLSAVRLALQFDEFYGDDDPKRAQRLLDAAGERLASLESGETPWADAHGLVVRGYRSSIDDSVQPYGLVIPDDLDRDRPAPLYVWLHGRGDKITNLHFLHQRMSSVGRIAPADAIVVHPFGRQCVGYKSAGEIDVLEAVEDVCAHYQIDRRRIVLMGFSMGGAGCWHVGAHYPDRWVAMSPGAGFAETAQYQSLNPDDIVWYERTLWGLYDVPDYVRNLFNLPVIAYSGEKDKQIQAARVMEQAFAAEGSKLDHRIGPGMGHKYYPDTLAAILGDLKTARDRGLDSSPSRVTLQTRTLRYHQVHWVDVQRLDEHWRDSRVDAEVHDRGLNVATRNVAALRLAPPGLSGPIDVDIDGQSLRVTPTVADDDDAPLVRLVKIAGQWSAGSPDPTLPAKRPGLQGPIDDVFLEPFLIVLGSGRSADDDVQRWVEFEQQHQLERWQALFRGRARVKRDAEVTSDDLARYHLVLWGDPSSNSILARIADRLPVQWGAEEITVGDRRFPAAGHVLTMISPNPESPERYVVLNSGPTFREAHDRTNSLQNPKLPDWAIFDLSQLPAAESAGSVVAADFFDERWNLKPTQPAE